MRFGGIDMGGLGPMVAFRASPVFHTFPFGWCWTLKRGLSWSLALLLQTNSNDRKRASGHARRRRAANTPSVLRAFFENGDTVPISAQPSVARSASANSSTVSVETYSPPVRSARHLATVFPAPTSTCSGLSQLKKSTTTWNPMTCTVRSAASCASAEPNAQGRPPQVSLPSVTSTTIPDRFRWIQRIRCGPDGRSQRCQPFGLQAFDLVYDVGCGIGSWTKTQVDIGAAVRACTGAVGQQTHPAKRCDIGQGVPQCRAGIRDPGLARDIKAEFIHGGRTVKDEHCVPCAAGRGQCRGQCGRKSGSDHKGTEGIH